MIFKFRNAEDTYASKVKVWTYIFYAWSELEIYFKEIQENLLKCWNKIILKYLNLDIKKLLCLILTIVLEIPFLHLLFIKKF